MTSYSGCWHSLVASVCWVYWVVLSSSPFPLILVYNFTITSNMAYSLSQSNSDSMPHTHALESTLIDHEFAIMQYVVGGQRLHMNFVRENYYSHSEWASVAYCDCSWLDYKLRLCSHVLMNTRVVDFCGFVVNQQNPDPGNDCYSHTHAHTHTLLHYSYSSINWTKYGRRTHKCKMCALFGIRF